MQQEWQINYLFYSLCPYQQSGAKWEALKRSQWERFYLLSCLIFLQLDRKVHKCHLPLRQSNSAGRSVLLLRPAAHTVCTPAPGYSDWTFPVWRCSAGSSDIHSRCGKREFPAGGKQKAKRYSQGGIWDQGMDAMCMDCRLHANVTVNDPEKKNVYGTTGWLLVFFKHTCVWQYFFKLHC